MLTIQYLEDSPALAGLDQSMLISRLQAAAECLPFSHLLIGWRLPPSILEALRREADQLGMRFLRWQPLLTSDQAVQPDSGWQTEGLTGHKVPGFQMLPEFTFFCPNHPAVQEAICRHLETLARQGIYQGFFLDRVRLPSPAWDPTTDLACFCEHCCRKAAEEGLDLIKIRKAILGQVQAESGRISLVKTLLSAENPGEETFQDLALRDFIAFRQRSICNYLTLVTRPLRDAHLELGLDCFSPCLSRMVGQDLVSMGKLVDWVKLMTYAHSLAPAGLPYEFLGMKHLLTTTTSLGEAQVMEFLSTCSGIQLPANSHDLETIGVSSAALRCEVKRGVDAVGAPVLAGIELVDLPGVTHLSPAQIKDDLLAVMRAGPAGLALSWDLLHIPLDRLQSVRKIYLGNHQ